MTHEEAIRDLAVERYLLQEMPEESRTAFEEHFFECQLCAEDLVAGRRLMDAGKIAVQESSAARSPRPRSWRDWFFGSWVLVPALAAALLVIVYQNAVLVPHLHQQVAQANAPELINTLVLANSNARGGDIPSIVVPLSGSVVLAVDIPAREGTRTYNCLLVGPSGNQLWSIAVPADRVENTVSLRVPAGSVQPGQNTLLLQAQPGAAGSPVELGRYVFHVRRQ